MSELVRMKWLERVVKVSQFHRKALRTDPQWNVKETASVLGCSERTVYNDLTVASWLKTHQTQLERIRNFSEVLEYIRLKKKEMRLEE